MRGRDRNQGRLKLLIGLVAMTFAVTLAVIVGNRLSDEALAVLAGAVCGVGAAIPTSLLIVVVSRRYDGHRDSGEAGRSGYAPLPYSQGVYPPVVVVAPPGDRQRFGDWNALSSSLTSPMQRQFTVVGGEQGAQRVNGEVGSYGSYS